jgi:hypothetical protein
MDVPNQLLNSTDKIIHESQKANIQTVNLQAVLWEAPEQMDSLRGSQIVRRKIALAENSELSAFLVPQGNIWASVKRNRSLL